jgi:dTDP-4-dehydrorhamnose reductase
MRTLILGAKGQLGRDLLDHFRRQGETEGVDLPELDITDAGAVGAVFARFRPDLAINAAAYTDVEGAEDHAAIAFRVNEAGGGCVARAAAECGCMVVYYSTDYVFDGAKRTPYTPEDPVAPAGVYARSKAAGEAATRQANPCHFIVRTAWLYGPGGNNFVEKILRAAASRPALKVVEDEVGSPTHTRDLAGATAALCATRDYGIYHAVNAGSCSRYAFAKTILRLAGISTPVTPCASSEFRMKARRPVYSVLSNAKLEERTGHVMRPWEDALKDYLERRQRQA